MGLYIGLGDFPPRTPLFLAHGPPSVSPALLEISPHAWVNEEARFLLVCQLTARHCFLSDLTGRVAQRKGFLNGALREAGGNLSHHINYKEPQVIWGSTLDHFCNAPPCSCTRVHMTRFMVCYDILSSRADLKG